MHDYVPPSDGDFDHFAREIFIPYVLAHFAALGLTGPESTALQNAGIAWGYAWTGYGNADQAMKAATTEKDLQRSILEAMIRVLVQKIQNNPNVTDVQRTAAGLPIYKTTKTPANAPTTVPVLTKVDGSTRGILRLYFADEHTPASKAKPAGTRGCEIREQIGGPAPVNPETMAFLAVESRGPYRADFEPEDVGKTVYLAFRWHSTRSEVGPWSKIYSATIPV